MVGGKTQVGFSSVFSSYSNCQATDLLMGGHLNLYFGVTGKASGACNSPRFSTAKAIDQDLYN
jgi:hypothetical protein